MKYRLVLSFLSLALSATVANAATTLVAGTPGNSQLATPSKPSPDFGGTFLNFDSLTPFDTFLSYTAQGVTISSPDGFTVLPFSTQSGPNELYDNGTNGSFDGTANILISLNSGTTAIGVGIADSDGVDVTLEALGQGGTDLGTFTEFLNPDQNDPNFGNFYFVLEDSTADIYGLELTQDVANPNFSGLAIDDVQVTPEPSSMVLMATGLSSLAGFGAFRRFKRA